MNITLNIAALIMFMAFLLSGGNSFAQVLAVPTSATVTLDVSQFGMPADAKFVFCSTESCPERSLKHLAMPAPTKVVSPQVPQATIRSEITMPGPVPVQSLKPPAATDPPPVKKAKPPGRHYKRHVQPKPRADIECRPPSKGQPK